MTTLRADGHDVGQLLSYALQPKTRPGADGDYAHLLRRYQDEPTFREAFDAVTGGLNLRILAVTDLGVVLSARRESVFAYKLSSETATWSKEPARVLRGLAHFGIAAYVYPHSDDLQDSSVRYVDVLKCEDFIRRACTQLNERAEAVATGSSEDRIVDLGNAVGLDAGWTEWVKLPAVRVSTKGRSSGRILAHTGAYWVQRACKDLVDNGMARPVGKDTDGRFQLLERYRVQVGASASLEGYQALTALARIDSELPDPHTAAGLSPLPGLPPEFADDPIDAGNELPRATRWPAIASSTERETGGVDE
jgi:hypothetical protein